MARRNPKKSGSVSGSASGSGSGSRSGSGLPESYPEVGFVMLPFLFATEYLYFLIMRPQAPSLVSITHDATVSILANMGCASLGFILARRLITVVARYHLQRKLVAFDTNKKGTTRGDIRVPESLGIAVGIVFLVVTTLSHYFNITIDSNWDSEYYGALTSIFFVLLLGYITDVFHLQWKGKILLPSVAVLPLLMAYSGHTTIVVPKLFVQFIGHKFLDIGCMYKLYMCLLPTFCSNAIRMHGGINGLEVGQTIAIATSVVMHNLIQMTKLSDPDYQRGHMFSIYLVQPLLITSLPLFYSNWYPASVFVGDTYSYFAGMTLAIAGIMGHFSETLLLFFLPQIINFILSARQLSGFIPFPLHRRPLHRRPLHRRPRFDPETGLLTGTQDGTLVNLVLRKFGQLYEVDLCIILLVFQTVCCYLCFQFRLLLNNNGWYK